MEVLPRAKQKATLGSRKAGKGSGIAEPGGKERGRLVALGPGEERGR